MEWLRASRWRMAGVGAAVAIAVAAVTIAVAATSTPSRPAQRIATATTGPVTQPPTTPAPPDSPLPTLAPLTSPSTDAPPATTTAPVPSTSTTAVLGPCPKDQLSVDAAPDHGAYAVGEPVLLTVTLVDTGTAACTVSRPPGWATLSITHGRTPTWATGLAAGPTLRLEPQQAAFAGSEEWAQNQCQSDPCGTGGPAVPPGSYQLVATVSGVSSARVTFTITTTTPSTSVPPSTAPAAGA
jgi:hypothetical protein